MPLLLAVGVNSAENTWGSAVDESAERLPPLVVMSLASKPEGISENENRIVAVSPALSVPLSLLIARVGARLSKLIGALLPPAPELPAVSV